MTTIAVADYVQTVAEDVSDRHDVEDGDCDNYYHSDPVKSFYFFLADEVDYLTDLESL